MLHVEKQVVQFAVATRVCVTLLVLLTTHIVTPYDTSSQSASNGSALAAFANWDGVYFTTIAQNGYEYEHFHAFFPLYPLLIRLLSSWLPIYDSRTATLVSGWLISNGSFVLAAFFLYRLSVLVLKDELTARRAAYLFCIAPSSIFLSAIYSESLMCFVSFSGMYYLERHKRTRSWLHLVFSALLFGAASVTRSNGILLSLYIAWYQLTVSPSPWSSPLRFLSFWCGTALLGLIAVGPQIAYFLYGMTVYCPSLFSSSAFLATDRPWCANVFPNLSAMYVFVQHEYWNVGFLRYYEWKQLPNFLLAAPIIKLSVHAIWRYFQSYQSKAVTTTTPNSSKACAMSILYYVHWLFLLINALLVVHIQVTTRLLSSCPPLFWAPATFGFNGQSMTTYGKAVVTYFLLYNVLGAVLFSSFYPWT